MTPDALPVRPLRSTVTLPPDALGALFGRGYALRGTERVGLVRLGKEVARVPVRSGPTLRLALDGVDRDGLGGLEGLRLCGPSGSMAAPPPETQLGRLVLPERLAAAWGVGAEAVVAMGAVAVRLPVEAGADAGVEVDRALWLGAGSPTTARWRPGLDLGPAEPEPAEVRARVVVVPRRVVTETDVRQARLKRQTLRIEPGQIVTPAARTLGRDLGVIVDAPPPLGAHV